MTIAERKQTKLEKALQDAIQQATDGLTKEEFVQSFELVVKIVEDIKKNNSEEFNAIHEAVKLLSQQVKDDAGTELSEIKNLATETVKNLTTLVNDKLASVKNGDAPTSAELLQIIEPLIPDAVAIDEIAIANMAEAKLEKNLPSLGISIRDGLELITEENEKLSPTAIQGWSEFEKKVFEVAKKGGGRIGWGAHPLTIQQSGTTKAKVARVINFTGATVSVSASGVITVAITGGSGLAFETPTGTIDGSNKTFVATSTPKYIVVDGITYFENDGYSLSGTTITTVVAPTGFIRDAY